MENIAIVGVGLIGGSFGLAMKQAGFRGTITGVSSPAAVRAARLRGAIDEALPLAEAVASADFILLAQPIGRIMDTLRKLEGRVRPGALVTDAGSTKNEIVSLAHRVLTRCQFLGGHPMAGKESRGVERAEPDLFRGRSWVLAPGSESELETPAARSFLEWLERIGARVVVLGAAEHDWVVALTSHLPQLASTALAATVAEQIDSPRDLAVSGQGLVDMTRLALSAYDLWRDILATNAEPIEAALAAYIQKLEQLRENLRTREAQREFEQGAKLAESVRGTAG